MFQKVEFYDGGELPGWQPFLDELSKDKPAGIVLFVADETQFDYKQIQPLLKKMEINILGCIFPEVIYKGSRYKKGVVGCTFKAAVAIKAVKNLNDFKGNLSRSFITENTESILVFYDYSANNTTFFIETLYEISGKSTTFLGGGAGSLKDKKRPSLFTADEYFTDGAIVAAVEDYISIGISHGLQPIFEPFIASEVNKQILKSINWQPAFEYYKNIVEKDAGIKITKDNFFDIAKSYPLGMLKYDNEIIPRCPLAIKNENSILLGGEIPENSIMVVMKGNHEKLVTAAGLTAEQAKTAFKNKKKKSPVKVLIIECITRTMFLENKFKDQIKLIESKAGSGALLFGILSLGEIASISDKYIEQYNETLVIGMGE
jgi:hypothetical protein